MKVLLLGATGQLGCAFRKVGESLDLLCPDRETLDLLQTQQVKRYFLANRPQVIINAAAYTAVDLAQNNTKQAYALNVEAVETLAKLSKQIGALLIHFSTDYVFDGKKKKPYIETDIAHPINFYGQTKYQSEQVIQAFANQYVILRISWLMGAYGKNFLKTILRLAREKAYLEVVNDQIGAPTESETLASVIVSLIKSYQYKRELPFGLYHLSHRGSTTWFDLAVWIVEKAHEYGGKNLVLRPEDIQPISTINNLRLAQRPAFSYLDSHKFEQTFGMSLGGWKIPLESCLEDLIRCQ